MAERTTAERVKECIEDVLSCDVNATDRFTDELLCSDVDIGDITCELEDEFGITISVDESEGWETVADAVQTVEQELGTSGEAQSDE